jgi:hypothetical protein
LPRQICDDTYSNKSWTVVGQGLFGLAELNQMERELAGYLEWAVTVEGEEVDALEVRRSPSNSASLLGC